MTIVQQVLGNLKKGLLFIISAPAGTGKTTLVNRLTDEFPCIVRNITSTTRPPRPEEKDGVDYYFLSRENFREKMKKGEMLEHVTLYGEQYGSTARGIQDLQNAGKHVLLVIDTQGARAIRNSLDVTSMMIVPPSLDVLQHRLQHRHTETREKQAERLAWAKKELHCVEEYDYVVVNDDLDVAYAILRSIFIAVESKETYYKERKKL